MTPSLTTASPQAAGAAAPASAPAAASTPTSRRHGPAPGTGPRARATAIADEAAPERDGPTRAFRTHHSTVERGDDTGGRRVHPRLEKLLEAKEIAPEHFQAGRMFASAFECAFGSSGGSAFLHALGGGRSAWTDLGTISRVEATARWRAAIEALTDAADGSRDGGQAWGGMLQKFLVQDSPLSEIGREAGMSPPRAKATIVKGLAVLAEHYATLDRKRGRVGAGSSRAAGVRRRYEPSVADTANNSGG